MLVFFEFLFQRGSKSAGLFGSTMWRAEKGIETSKKKLKNASKPDEFVLVLVKLCHNRPIRKIHQ